ncbi:class I SAM-dependent methyltransferase [Opitutus terrae]|uniref:Methyltransferase type 11 n=1 Tax=Opitutus terrae (strain DSM 11246 / JCM 15787 / PB90-1) TaxID=452637 RepID=B1ZZS1_OPITP|nr:class I SAM-dependent methyltransferase [Opitutus terrae]ACB77257.1 Methyltransferase type 11 [Opitutus terrae PB90-1]
MSSSAPPPRLDEGFYRAKSWGSVPIQTARDLPSLKLRYLLELLQSRSSPRAQLLEVGSGSGRILSSIHGRDPELQLTGIDLSAEQTELARRTHPSITFVCGNGEMLPFGDATFDYVIFFDYLEHIERPAVSLAEMSRVLKPGGYLHLVCPAEKQSIFGLSSRLFGRHFKETTAGHIQQFLRADLEALVRAAGLSVIDRRYSYHLLGSLMDYTLFTLMLHPRIYQMYWRGNPYYATSVAPRKRGVFQRLLEWGNAVAYFESSLLERIAFSACAVHLTARKVAAAAATNSSAPSR